MPGQCLWAIYMNMRSQPKNACAYGCLHEYIYRTHPAKVLLITTRISSQPATLPNIMEPSGNSSLCSADTTSPTEQDIRDSKKRRFSSTTTQMTEEVERAQKFRAQWKDVQQQQAQLNQRYQETATESESINWQALLDLMWRPCSLCRRQLVNMAEPTVFHRQPNPQCSRQHPLCQSCLHHRCQWLDKEFQGLQSMTKQKKCPHCQQGLVSLNDLLIECSKVNQLEKSNNAYKAELEKANRSIQQLKEQKHLRPIQLNPTEPMIGDRAHLLAHGPSTMTVPKNLNQQRPAFYSRPKPTAPSVNSAK